MALIFNDDFEPGNLYSWSYSYDAAVVGGSLMNGVYCLELTDKDGYAILYVDSLNEMWGSFDILGTNVTGAVGPILVFKSGGTVLGELVAAGTGVTPITFQIAAYNGISTLLGTSSAVLNAGEKHTIQFYYKPHATTGVFQVWIDDILEIDFTGVTAPSTTAIGSVLFGDDGSDNAMWARYDDVNFYDADPNPSNIEGIVSDESVGTPLLTYDQDLYPAGMETAGGLGYIYVNAAFPDGIASEEIIGAPTAMAPPSTSVTRLVGSGGFKFRGPGVSGDSEFIFSSPEMASVGDGGGGFRFCGFDITGRPTIAVPVSLIKIGKGGFKLEGRGIWYRSESAAIPSLLLVGSGGLRFSGQGVFTYVQPKSLRLVGSGGFRFGGFRTDRPRVTYPDLYTAIGSPVVFRFGGGGIWLLPRPIALAVIPSKAVFGLGGTGIFSVVYPPTLLLVGIGGFCIGGTGLEAPAVDTWVLSGNSFEPSMYTNYGFNSFAKFGNQYYGIKDDGIYLLAGLDDDGERITPAIRIGPINLGNANYKRIREINVGDDGEGMRIRMEGNGKEGISPVVRGKAGGHRNIQARSFIIDIAGFDKLSHLEITALTVGYD